MFINSFRQLLLSLRFLLFLSLLMIVSCNRFPSPNDDIPLLYLGWDENNVTQLFSILGGESQKLTDFADGVHDYSPSPNGRNIILTALTDQGDSELWMMEMDGTKQALLYSCPKAECANFTWAPDSRRLLFERRGLDNGYAGTPFLWWLDTDTASVLPLQENSDIHGANGRLSPDGQWISYFSPEDEGLYVYNLKTGSSQFIINEIGAEVSWSPDNTQLVLPQLDLVILHGEEGDDHQTHQHDYQTAVHLLRLDVNTGEKQIISGDLSVEDSVPAWSPDGNWIAFGRRAIGTGAPRQLWIIHPDGGEARALTDDPAINHGPPIWSADGRLLIFQQIPADDFDSMPSIWRLDIETGEKEELVPAGMLPAYGGPRILPTDLSRASGQQVLEGDCAALYIAANCEFSPF
jgi:TolB protein